MRLKDLFEEELEEESRDKCAEDELALGMKGICRQPNRDWIVKLDNMLFQGLDLTLQSFLPKQRWAQLPRGATRYVVLGPDGTPRSCVQLEDGRRFYECPKLLVDGKRQDACLHVSADQGSVGLPGLLWLQHSKGARVTVAWDPLHRLHNDLLEATSSAGLMLVRLEYMNVVRMRIGPFDAQSNWSVLKSVSEEM